MWRRQRRLHRLEAELAQARAERAALSRRLEAFEQIAAQAGRSLPDGRSDAAGPGPVQASAPPPAGLGTDGLGATAVGPAGQAPWLGPADPVPPVLLAAARDLRPEDVPVRLTVDGQDMVAVVGGPGDPREWWTAIWQLGHYVAGSRRSEP